MRHILALIGAVVLLAGPLVGAAAAQNAGTATYDLLFRNGTLDDLARDTALVYDRTVANRAKPEAATRDTGTIALSFSETDGKEVATLQFRQDGKHRNLGSFPASVGNPMIMFFYETVVRDMAEAAGGSPFYIRNRVKDSLIQPAEVTRGTATFEGAEVETVTVTLRPFAEDPNRAQMSGFGDLALAVTMSEAVPGWYLTLAAEAPHPEGGDPIYRSVIAFDGLEDTQ
ncbi:hypothetical protein [Roseivivax isoporae]|uniref:Uncharacterized protein n=1 Tax=Roseivivax isoporae LMG 25204 TaxID=1449351 RepID=X7F9B0_9RHOB|nr:hypothetical protein [Roseivivax isoporae]ETX28659.1 hypothetical protein RISW2_05015 [Roseivivax isoporae LMG 25204]